MEIFSNNSADMPSFSLRQKSQKGEKWQRTWVDFSHTLYMCYFVKNPLGTSFMAYSVFYTVFCIEKVTICILGNKVFVPVLLY